MDQTSPPSLFTDSRGALKAKSASGGGHGVSQALLKVVTLADEPLAGQALSALLGSSKLVEVARYAGALQEWEAALAPGTADTIVWFGRCADRGKLEMVNAIRYARPGYAVCLVTERVESLALRDVIRNGAERLAVVLRTPQLDVADLLKSLVQLGAGRATLSPEVLEQLVADASVDRDRIDALTDAEQQVLRLLSAGLRNREIARRLDTSEKVVERKVTRIFVKLDLRQAECQKLDRRVMAARMFVLRGQLDTA